jgi:hypothetical protein
MKDPQNRRELFNIQVVYARVPIPLLLPRGGPTQQCGREAVNTIEETSACRVDQPEE